MSDSDSDGEGGLGLDGFLWGNIGEGDQLEVDYLDQVNSLCRCARDTLQENWVGKSLAELHGSWQQ